MRVGFVEKGARRYDVHDERERAPDLFCGSIGAQRKRRSRLPGGRLSEQLAEHRRRLQAGGTFTLE
jgi:hypothetical protein